MKVLHINTSDTSGGAAIAALRLHRAMLKNGIESEYFVLNRSISDDTNIKTVSKKGRIRQKSAGLKRSFFNKLNLSNKKGLFSNAYYGLDITKEIDVSQFDVIYIHWVNFSFLSLKNVEKILKTGKTVIWFMHDMFPITGGCHHSFECNGYKAKCGNCPYLKHSGTHDFSNKQMQKKIKLFSKYTNLSFAAPSKWLYECAKQSSLAVGHNVYHIPNLLNSDIYKPVDKDFARSVLCLPKDKKLILFGADSALTNPYKGFEYFEKAIDILKNDNSVDTSNTEVVIFGSSYNSQIAERLHLPAHFMGYLKDEYSTSLLYNACDVFCIPSLAENFANTIMESIHCKTPVVGFNVGGIPDIVGEKTGYLAKYEDSNDFARGINEVLFGNRKYSFEYCESVTPEKILKLHSRNW